MGLRSKVKTRERWMDSTKVQFFLRNSPERNILTKFLLVILPSNVKYNPQEKPFSVREYENYIVDDVGPVSGVRYLSKTQC